MYDAVCIRDKMVSFFAWYWVIFLSKNYFMDTIRVTNSLSGLIWVQNVGNGYTFNPWMTKVAACLLGNFASFFVVCWFFQNQLFWKIISGIPLGPYCLQYQLRTDVVEYVLQLNTFFEHKIVKTFSHPSVLTSFWLLKRTISLRRFFWVPTTYILLKKIK